jgi:hypothetical protein
MWSIDDLTAILMASVLSWIVNSYAALAMFAALSRMLFGLIRELSSLYSPEIIPAINAGIRLFFVVVATFHAYCRNLPFELLCLQFVALFVLLHLAWIGVIYGIDNTMKNMEPTLDYWSDQTGELVKRADETNCQIGKRFEETSCQTKKTTKDIYKRIRDVYNRIEALQTKTTESSQSACQRIEELKNDMKKQIDIIWREMGELSWSKCRCREVVDVDMNDSEYIATAE